MLIVIIGFILTIASCTMQLQYLNGKYYSDAWWIPLFTVIGEIVGVTMIVFYGIPLLSVSGQ